MLRPVLRIEQDRFRRCMVFFSKRQISVLVATVDRKFRDAGELEEEKGLSSGDTNFYVSAGMVVNPPAVSIGRGEAGGEGILVYRFPVDSIVTELDLNIGRQNVNAEEA